MGDARMPLLNMLHSLVILFFAVLPVWLSGCSEMTGNTRTAKAH